MLAFNNDLARDVGEIDLVLETLHHQQIDAVFDQPFEQRQALLSVLKTMVETGRQALKTAFMANNDGAAYVGAHAILMDHIIQLIHASVMNTWQSDAAPKLAMIATGGYGRGELSPHSDVDLLFLTEVKPNAEHVQVIEFILYLLWDLGDIVCYWLAASYSCSQR